MYQTLETGNKQPVETSYEGLLLEHLRSGRIPDNELIMNAHVFLRRQNLSHLLQLNEIYQHILKIPGIIVQCGVRWGGDLLTFQSLRSLYEPYNYSRRIVGFDTFEGLVGTEAKDQGATGIEVKDGQFAVSAGYPEALNELFLAAERQSPIPHIRKQQLIAGDASQTVPGFLQENQGEMLALLYLDMDIYKPTQEVLKACQERLTPGAVVVFDEYGSTEFPGEAIAARELQSVLELKMCRSQFGTVTAYGIYTP